MGTSVDTCQKSGNTFSPTAKGAPGSDPACPRMVSRVMMKGQQKSLKRRRRTMMMMMKSPVPMLRRLVQTPRILSRVPTWVNLLIVQTLACHPASLGLDYQRNGTAQLQ